VGCPRGRKIFKGDTPPSKNEIVPIQEGNHRPAFGRQPARDLGGQSNPEHALEDCTIRLESNSFRIPLSAGYNSFQAFDAVDDAVKVNRHQTLPKFSEIVSPLHYCAYATGCREKRTLLTEQALPLSEGSLPRQQVFVLAPAVSTLCRCIKWMLQVTAVLFCHEH